MAEANSNTLRLGTRGSLLAKTQSQLAASELEKRHKGLVVELVIVRTSGDQVQDKPLHELGGKGLFVKELEQALLAGEIDLAVHSFKDVPVTRPLVDQTDLIIAAVPPREDPRDVFCSLKAKTVAELPAGSRVGTGSLRRRAQLLAARPDLVVENLRGNIDTRLKKLRDGVSGGAEAGGAERGAGGRYDAIILAAAGLRRTGMYNEAEMTLLDPAEMLCAPGQGALAVQCRRGDARMRDLLEALDDPTTERCVTAERVIVAALNGDCSSPIGALAEIAENQMTLQVAVGRKDGHPPVIRACATGPADPSDAVLNSVLKSLSDQKVQELLGGGR